MRVRSKKTVLILLGIALLFGILYAGYFFPGEFQHNSQGEYFDTVTGVVDYPYAIMMFAMGVVFATLIALFAEIVLYQIISFFLDFRRHKIKRKV